MADKPVVQTTVEKVEANPNDLLQIAPGATSVVTPTRQTPGSTVPDTRKPSIFSREMVDLSFLDEKDTPTTPSPAAAPPATTPTDTPQTPPKPGEAAATDTPAPSFEDILGDIGTESNPGDKQEQADPGKGGRPKTDKSGLVETFTKLIADGKLIAFDDDKPLTEYGPKDFEELLDANFQQRDQKTYDQISKDFFESLPRELQYAAKYVLDGGKDLKSLFQALSQAEQSKELNPDKADDHEAIYRQYLTAINFGSPEEIEEDIRTWKDLGQLDKKAKQAKPKLDKLQEQIVTRQLQQQEVIRQQNETAARAYVENVYKALEPGVLNGLKLDKKTQSFLYNSMVTAQYPSITGKQTNLLGHLLEKYQYSEPNYPLIAEALWLLSDPQGYRTKLMEAGASQETIKTVRTLKTEEGRKTTGNHNDTPGQEPESSGPSATRKLQRPGNIFRRN